MEFAKKLFTKAVQYLNVAFVGYEVSEITQNSNTQQIIQTKTVEKDESSTHITVVITFGIVLCIVLTILYALKIILSNKKSKRNTNNSQSNTSQI